MSIVDDNAYAFLLDPDDAVTSVAAAATVIFEEYERSALRLHLDAKNTACMFSWAGKGARDVRIQVEDLVERLGGIPFSVAGRQLHLPLAARYKHARRKSNISSSVRSLM